MKKYDISILFFIVSVILFMTSAIVGSHLDANGMLIEPAFFCIPLGYLSLIISVFTALYQLFKGKFINTVSK
ncbi:DUF3955 domain-containing protein [Enterococcus faecium]|uniref:DUF3955 domain-containing protein n=1 Tax=Enterococcus faecium TaxID=1352 RepID=A0A7V7KS14_ENTFC|nr:DUF3955 domain-containing protein [Enterococcus faecium]EGP4841541.1 DUF3955 domain-containing protein [Enterococcus faecium]EME7220698.1 DUF3955 domain-containing protein [Enterococcus faecium]EOH55856.1 hypothetical protein UA3_01037 [Enterococcus faecium EnGen0263]KAA0689032.1 DUF3955 domain-containing protein [Enterococcus faecium]MBK5028183.1 DUF3955 domain-containing protein [Enterococcus faecium]